MDNFGNVVVACVGIRCREMVCVVFRKFLLLSLFLLLIWIFVFRSLLLPRLVQMRAFANFPNPAGLVFVLLLFYSVVDFQGQ